MGTTITYPDVNGGTDGTPAWQTNRGDTTWVEYMPDVVDLQTRVRERRTAGLPITAQIARDLTLVDMIYVTRWTAPASPARAKAEAAIRALLAGDLATAVVHVASLPAPTSPIMRAISADPMVLARAIDRQAQGTEDLPFD